MRKKALSWLLAVSMVVSLFISVPITASAVDYAGNAAVFNSAGNSFIQVADSNSLDVVNALTVEAWIKPNGGGEWALIAGKQLNPADSEPWYSYRLNAASVDFSDKGFPNEISFLITTEDNVMHNVVSSAIINNNVWTHVAGVYDGSELKIYINGVFNNSIPVTGNIKISNLPLYIGKAPWTNFNNYNGMMDELRVWNVARTAAQISSDSQRILTGSEPGLVSYWNFNEAPGQTIIADASGNSNAGTLYEASLAASDATLAAPASVYWTGYAASAFAGGDGSSGNPYRIATAEQLAYLASIATNNDTTTSGKYYAVTADIDLSDYYWTPIAYFKGHFDGNNHTISGLTINGTSNYQGLFGQCYGAELKNIRISGCSITSIGSYAGALLGGGTNLSISGCVSAGSVTAKSHVGGLIGALDNSTSGGTNTITHCGSYCTVISPPWDNDNNAGGLVGIIYAGNNTIEECFSTGNVSGRSSMGGLIGFTLQNAGTLLLKNSYSTGNVTGGSYTNMYGGIYHSYALGGMIGHCQNFHVTVQNSYQSGLVTGMSTSAGGGILGEGSVESGSAEVYYNSLNTTDSDGTAKTADDMKLPVFVATLNGSASPAPWAAAPSGQNGGFPMLAWQTAPTTYTVSIGALSGGSITAHPTSAAAGATIDLTIAPDPGKQLKAGTLKYNDGADHAIAGTSFTMPAVAVTVTAEFENAPVTGLTEDFDTHGLSGWAVADINGTAGDWAIISTPLAHSGASSARFNSFSAPTGASARLYQTSDLSIPSGQALSFWMYHSTSWSSSNDTVSAQISADGGSSWQTLGTYSRVNGTTAWEKIELDLSSYTGQTVRFGFLGISALGDHLYIDDISLNGSTPAAPTLQSAETSVDGTKVILTFNRAMADPTGKHGQFTVTANENAKTVTAAALKSGENYKIELTLTTPVTSGQTVTVSYTKGTVTALDGTALATFAGENVTNTVPANVAQIGSTGYPTLAAALAAAASTDTIVLLSDIGYSNAIVADAKSVNIDLNGHNLTVSGVEGHALNASNNGVLNILDDDGPGVLTVNSSGEYRHCVHAESGGKVNIKGNLTATMPSGGGSYQDIIGAYANDTGSAITLTGNASGTMAGIYSQKGAVITVSGNVSGSYCGAYSAYYGSVNVTGTVSGSYALRPEYGGIAVVTGNITGGAAGIYTNNIDGWAAPRVTVTGNVTGTGGESINAGNAADIEITGDVTGYVVVSGSGATCPVVTVNGDITVSSGFGVSVYYGGTVTVNGRILGASPYLKLNDLDIAQNAYVIDGDYFKYSNETVIDPALAAANTVYVAKTNQAPVITSNWNYTTVYFGKDYAYTLTVTDAENTPGTKVYFSLDGAAYWVIGNFTGAPGTQNITLSPLKGILAAGSHTLQYYAEDTGGAVSSTLTLTFTVTDEPTSPPPTGGGTPAASGTMINVSTTDGSSSVEGTLTQSNGGTQVVIKNDAFDKVDAANKPVSVSAQLATVTFDKKAMDAIGSASSSGDVTLTVRKVGASELTAAQKAIVGSRPVYDFTIKGGGTTISSFGGGFATVSIPYKLQPGENPHAVVIWYLSDSGKLVGTRGCYDAATGTVTFMTPHFSSFVIGYNAVSFADVASDAWYHDAVTFLAARGITSGTTVTTFGPNATLTRGQFIVMLLRAYGIEPDSNTADNFSDAGNTYYTGYLAAAKRLGIANGVGNNMFAPDKSITRQEMFTLLYNALKVIGELPTITSGKTLSDFSDVSGIASWAKDAMTLLVESGTISGSGGKLNPTGTTTRAEMAQVLFNLLAK